MKARSRCALSCNVGQASPTCNLEALAKVREQDDTVRNQTLSMQAISISWILVRLKRPINRTYCDRAPHQTSVVFDPFLRQTPLPLMERNLDLCREAHCSRDSVQTHQRKMLPSGSFLPETWLHTHEG